MLPKRLVISRRWPRWAALLLVILPLPAEAGLFCVQSQGASPRCDYEDAAECRHRAQQLSSLCIVNPEEVTMSVGGAPYCRIDSTRSALCIYTDLASCDGDANRSGGVCSESAPLNKIQQNPYRYDPNRRY